MMFSYGDRVRDAELARRREMLKGSGRVVRTRRGAWFRNPRRTR
jgi:hypothetical protein